MGLSGIGPMDLMVVLIIALIVLGPKRLPEVGKSLGKGMRGFKDSLSGGSDRDDDELQIHPPVASAKAAITADDETAERTPTGSTSA